jgi:large subunit ribosomal protein L17
MRHLNLGRKFSRTSEHRHAMFSNLISALILHERIETTDPKAKTLKRLADRTISWGTSVGDILVKAPEKRSNDERAAVVHAMRMARRTLRHEEALSKLFAEVAPRFRGRTGGFTRVLKTRVRRGDAAPMSFVELVVRAEPEAPAPEPTPEGTKGKKGKKEAAPAAKAEAKPAKKAEKKADEKAEKKPKTK